MAKFNQSSEVRGQTRGAIRTVGEGARLLTGEGGIGWEREPKSELYLTAVSSMVGEDTFYETAQERDSRLVALIQHVTRTDPAWVTRFVRYLRHDLHMRSASIVVAAEYVAAGGRMGRYVVAAALDRPDEPGELLAYWRSTYGRPVPQAIRKGLADAVLRLYSERAAVKWDSDRAGYRMGDVIEVAHPHPEAQWQHDLFRWLLDTRHNRPDPRLTERLPVLQRRATLMGMLPGGRRGLLVDNPSGADMLSEAGITWEALSGWLQGPMDAAAWEAVIPTMGYMALLRNLRNFEQAGVSESTLDAVATRLADRAEVARSRQLPLRFLSAYRAVNSVRWHWPLEQALARSLGNVPSLPGRTLILIDASASMSAKLSGRSELTRRDAAGLFGFALALRAEAPEVWLYGSTERRVVELPRGSSLLPALAELPDLGGTDTYGTLLRRYAGHDRVVIVTDEQYGVYAGYTGYTADRSEEALRKVAPNPVITFNVGGERTAQHESRANLVTVGGLTDGAFRLVGLLDQNRRGTGWPF